MTLNRIMYSDIHNPLRSWLMEGKLKFDGRHSAHGWDEFDAHILKVFGYLPITFKVLRHNAGEVSVALPESITQMKSAAEKLTTDLTKGRLDVSWLNSEHAYAIWRSMEAKRLG